MSSFPVLLQNSVGSITIFLELAAGGPAVGLISSVITAGLKKEGESSFTVFAVSGSNFTEIGSGFYEVDFAASNTDVLGNLYLSITGSTVKTSLHSAYVAVAGSVSPTVSPPTLGLSLISGYLQDLSGNPIVNTSVSAKILNTPSLIPGSGGNIVGMATTTIVVKTDSQGYFSLSLVEGANVDIIIPAINYRRTILVPVSDTALFSIP